MTFSRPVITHVSQLEEHSTWRKYQRGLRELTLMEAPRSVISEFKYRAARECFLVFCDIMKSGDLRVSPFHELIGSAFEDLANRRYKRLIVSCPPRSGKSMLATMFLAWLLGRDQKTQHVIASYGASLSFKFHREAVQILKSKEFKRVFPEWLGFSPDSKYDMLGGGYILATSVGGVLTGFTAGTTDMESPGVGAMIIDDPLKSSDSKQALENLESWWQEQASTRRTNHFCQMVIATRFHEKDLHGVLIEGDGYLDLEGNGLDWAADEKDFGWRWINIAGICEDPENDPLGRELGESHWPDNPAFSVPMLESQRKIMGSFKFAALYQGVPKSAEGQIVKNSWVEVIEEEDCPELDLIWFGVDCAFSEKEMADESAICVVGINRRNPETIYICDLIKGKWGFPDLIEAVRHQYNFYKAKVLCIEKAASGQSLLQVLKKEARIPVEEMKPIKSKSTRLQAVTPLLEAGRVKIVKGVWTDAFIKELTAFPYVRHDDSVDAMTWALTYYLLKIDSSDRSMQESLSQMKKWGSNLKRYLPGYAGKEINSSPTVSSRYGERNLNDPDFGNETLRTKGYRAGKSQRRDLGYDTTL